MKVLIVEDDIQMAATLKTALQNLFVVETAATGEEGEYLAQLNCFDLILLDIILPDMHGADLSKKIRKAKIMAPILILTGQASKEEKMRAFASGADDYVTKPFELDELVARMHALLRRPSTLPNEKISVGDLTVDLSSGTVTRDGKKLTLRRKEYLILEYLMRNAGKVVTRQTLMDHVWEINEETTGNVVDVHIKYLRDQIDKNFPKKLVRTVHGLGYKIEA